MKNAIAVALALCALTARAQEYDASNFHAWGRRLQPPPQGHVPGRDNGPGEGLHNAGEDCAICHTPGGKAANYVFTIAGTVFEDRAARRPLENAEVILQDIQGGVLSMTTNRVGNFWSYQPIASDPHAVASHGGETHELFTRDAEGNVIAPADPADSRTWLYKAWIRNGEAVRPMLSIVPVGGATGTVPRMSCNMHHAPLGSSGSLWSSDRPTLAAYPAAALSFGRDIRPIFTARCAPCHVPGARRTRLVTASDVAEEGATAFDYSAGNDFTSWAGSSYAAAAVDGGTELVAKPGAGAFVDPAQPDQSPVLEKTRKGGAAHAGGAFWTVSDADYRAIRQWIAEGARDN